MEYATKNKNAVQIGVSPFVVFYGLIAAQDVASTYAAISVGAVETNQFMVPYVEAGPFVFSLIQIAGAFAIHGLLMATRAPVFSKQIAWTVGALTRIPAVMGNWRIYYEG